MPNVTIYGASDDLVEIEGDLREEFSTDECWLVFGDGTIVEVRYDELGIWRLQFKSKGTAAGTWQNAAGDDGRREGSDIPAYSEIITLDGDLSWVLVAEGVQLHRIGPERERDA